MKLKPCPFCGCEYIQAEIYIPLEEFRIYCTGDEGCSAEMRLAFSDAGIVGQHIDFDKAQQIMDELADAWNRRAGDDLMERMEDDGK